MMWTTQLLYGHEARLLNVTRVRLGVFKRLRQGLRRGAHLIALQNRSRILCKVKILSLIWSLTERSTQFQIQPSLRNRRH